MPAPSDHAAHDPLLLAAHAAGDASGAELERAAALVASCPDCARLHRDLRALPGALASAPAPARPRDFRLTAEQAEALRRPSGWRRLLAPLAGARSAAGPLAASLAALGLAGVLLGGGLTLGLGGSATSAPAPQAAAAGSAAGAPGSGNFDTAASSDAGPIAVSGAAGQPSAAPAAAASAEAVVSAAASAAASFAPAEVPSAAASMAPSAAAPVATSAPVAPTTPNDKNATNGGTTADATGAPSGTREANLAPIRPSPTATPEEPAPAAPSGPTPLVVGSLVLLLAGVILGVLRIAARRLV